MPTQNYEHINPITNCSMGKVWQVYRQASKDDLKLCDACNQPIKISSDIKKNPLLDAAKTYGPGNIPLPPPMSHPIPGSPNPPPTNLES